MNPSDNDPLMVALRRHNGHASSFELQARLGVSQPNVSRLIQSTPSPKAEPFKQWLAKVG